MHEQPTIAAARQRKLSARWILTGFCVLLAAFFLYQLFGPDPAIYVSEETTFITAPIDANGLPDYAAYLLQRGSAGVTPENNAAVLIWQTCWPGNLKEDERPILCKALGMRKIPAERYVVLDPYDRSVRIQILEDLGINFEEYSVADSDEEDFYGKSLKQALADHESSYDLIAEASFRPWTSEQSPNLADWVRQNRVPFDMLVEASKRSQYYSPSPSLLIDDDGLAAASLVPDLQACRAGTRGLHLRAMWHLGEGKPWLAWQDLLASQRIFQLVGENESTIALTLRYSAAGSVWALLPQISHGSQMSESQLREMINDIDSLMPVPTPAAAFNIGERINFLSICIGTATTESSGLQFLGDFAGIPVEDIDLTRINWNVALRKANSWFDDLARVARLASRSQRLAEVSRIDRQVSQLDANGDSLALVDSVVDEHRRSEIIVDKFIELFWPSVSFLYESHDRANCQLELTRLSAALAVYRARHGDYPDTLNQLVPEILTRVPVDLYSNDSFKYQRKRDGGYLLYSVYLDGVDDDGTDESGQVVNGEWDLDSTETYGVDSFDLVIRVPMPSFKLPQPPTREELIPEEYKGWENFNDAE